uniref:Chromosome 8 open reading frame 90 n=1 Tax=Phocoena sinus TaxID=42100 RepID=A0A8C9C5M4_PHOSS
MASPGSGDPSLAGLLPRPVATPGETRGPAATPEPPFPDIYCGDAQLWEAHFRGIGRAYCALGKEDDFAIRVLTEDFTLPFPFAWSPGTDPARGPLFYDPHDRTGFDFLLRGPDAPPPALLRPLHNTAQAAVRKRRLEQLALSYARAGGPGRASRRSCPRPPPAAPCQGPWGLRPPPPAGAPPGWHGTRENE